MTAKNMHQDQRRGRNYTLSSSCIRKMSDWSEHLGTADGGMGSSRARSGSCDLAFTYLGTQISRYTNAPGAPM